MAQPMQMTDLRDLLSAYPGKFSRVLQAAEEHRLQILISAVITNSAGRPVLERAGYRVGAEYFYPASSIKLCAAVAALQTIEQLGASSNCPDLLLAPMEIAPLFPGDAAQKEDPSNFDGGRLTLGQELRKLALVSDNDAFNRLFDVVGHEQLNRSMHDLSLPSVVINHRLYETGEHPKTDATAAVTFYPPHADAVQVPARPDTVLLTNYGTRLMVGKGFISNGQLVAKPMDFTVRNGISLLDLQNLLVKLVRPEIDLGSPPLKLSDSHRAWLLKAMTEYPRESRNPVYPAGQFPDDYCKYLLPGIRRVFPGTIPGQRVQVTDKIGQAYGFTIENCYLQNPANGKAVFVTAVIYANSRGILNNDTYDYKTVAAPFFADLGEVVARRWLADHATR